MLMRPTARRVPLLLVAVLLLARSGFFGSAEAQESWDWECRKGATLRCVWPWHDPLYPAMFPAANAACFADVYECSPRIDTSTGELSGFDECNVGAICAGTADEVPYGIEDLQSYKCVGIWEWLGHPYCRWVGCASSELGDRNCGDAMDNDCDGLIDGDDPDCPISYVALGDSFAAGTGAGNYDDSRCWRSLNAYSTYVHNIPNGRTSVNRSFHACFGATTKEFFLRHPDTGEIAQLDHPSLGGADLVSLSIGGNDFQFGPVVKHCLFTKDCIDKRPWGWRQTIREALPYMIAQDLPKRLRGGEVSPGYYAPNLYARLREKVPNDAAIFVLGYPRLFALPGTEMAVQWAVSDPLAQVIPPAQQTDCMRRVDALQDQRVEYCDPAFYGTFLARRLCWEVEERDFLNEMTSLADILIRREAEAEGFHYVPAMPAFAGHEICANAPLNPGLPEAGGDWWINTFALSLTGWPQSYHPNARGQAAYARALQGEIDALGLFQPTNVQAASSGAPEGAVTAREEGTLEAGPAAEGPLVLPAMGELRVEPLWPTGCGGAKVFAIGQWVGLRGEGFAPSGSVELLYQPSPDDPPIIIWTVLADSNGTLQTIARVLPGEAAGAVGIGMGMMMASGKKPDGGELLLLDLLRTTGDLSSDTDGDGVPDACDNCAAVSNAGQKDSDWDGLGDACDACPLDPDNDRDGDGLCRDTDACEFDPQNDGDGDGVCGRVDNCPLGWNADQGDLDGDGVGDICDNCPDVVNADQVDSDSNGIGDACDTDWDSDGVANDVDNCPLVANSNQGDQDHDGRGDACDPDVDNDGVANDGDTCPDTPLGSAVDPGSGCSIEQLCPCEGPRARNGTWTDHGEYVSCVVRAANSAALVGLINEQSRGSIVAASASSECGRPK